MAFITRSWILDLLILVLGLIVLAYLYMTRKFKYWKNRGVFELTPTAFVGNFWDCLMTKKNAGEWLKDMYDEGSGLPFIGFYIFDRPFLLIRDPKLVKQILVKDFNIFSNRFVSASPHDRIGEANLFMIKNPQWKLVRSKLTPIYTSGKVKKMFELMDIVGDDLLTLMESQNLGGKGKELEVKDLCARFTTDMIATTAFGIRANCLNDPNAEFREYGRKIFETSFKRNFELLSIFFLPQFLTLFKIEFLPKGTADFLRNTLWEVIRERERRNFQRGDLVDMLIELRNNKTEIFKDEFDFDGDNLLAQAIVFFNAGFETSSSALSFTLYEISLQQKIQDRLRAEIMEGLEKTEGKVTYDLASSLQYLDMVISETLRKYPPLPILDRVATEDYKIPDSNLVLKKGTPIIVPMLGLHYDPEYFQNPEIYDPERFSETNKKNILPCTYLPFGEGPHNCIGMRIGLLQTKVGLIKLLSKYEFTPCKRTLIPMRLSKKAVIIAADGGVFLQVKKL